MKHYQHYLCALVSAVMLAACGQATVAPEQAAAPSRAAAAVNTVAPAAATTARGVCEHAVKAQFLDPASLAFVQAGTAAETHVDSQRDRITGAFDVNEDGRVHQKSYVCTVMRGEDHAWVVDNTLFSNR